MVEAFMSTVTPALCAPLFDWLLDIDLPSYVFTASACSSAILAFIAACAYPRKPAQLEAEHHHSAVATAVASSIQ